MVLRWGFIDIDIHSEERTKPITKGNQINKETCNNLNGALLR